MSITGTETDMVPYRTVRGNWRDPKEERKFFLSPTSRRKIYKFYKSPRGPPFTYSISGKSTTKVKWYQHLHYLRGQRSLTLTVEAPHVYTDIDGVKVTQ